MLAKSWGETMNNYRSLPLRIQQTKGVKHAGNNCSKLGGVAMEIITNRAL